LHSTRCIHHSCFRHMGIPCRYRDCQINPRSVHDCAAGCTWLARSVCAARPEDSHVDVSLTNSLKNDYICTTADNQTAVRRRPPRPAPARTPRPPARPPRPPAGPENNNKRMIIHWVLNYIGYYITVSAVCNNTEVTHCNLAEKKPRSNPQIEHPSAGH
jgi:hypothetical protein